MLESLAAGLLNRFLGSYVENFDPKQLNVGIWSGDVKLKKLKLKKESLDALDLPIDVRFGFLGDLTLLVPWSSLKNKPVKILIEDVYLLCGPRDQSAKSFAEDEERELRLKLQKLDEYEALGKSQPTGKEDSSSSESFTQSLLTKVVDNLQISIKNIHIRYEDMDCVFGEVPYSLGATLSELSIVSTDEHWEPSFISITSSIARKLLTLNSLSVYWNTDCESVYHPDHDELFRRLRNSISSKKNIPDHEFLLRPVTGIGRLVLSKKGSTETNPHVDIALVFDEFGFDINNCQYEDILNTASKLHWYQKTLKSRKHRPNFPVSEDPKAWFKYAAKAVLQEVHEKNYKWSWDYIKWRRDRRIEYIPLWKKKLGTEKKTQSLSDEEQQKLKELHKELSFEDIKLFRALAKKSYLTEKLEVSNSAAESKGSSAAGSSGWFSSWWNGNSPQNDDDLVMSEEQQQELYDAIEFDENKQVIDSIDIPKDRITAKVTCVLNRGSLSIVDKNRSIKLGEMVFEGCETEFLQRPDSFFCSFKLHEFKVEDGSPNTLYKHIVSVKNLQMNEGNVSQHDEPFFKVAVEKNPLDDSADSKIDIKLRSMTIFYHVHFVNEIIKLFRPPRQHLDTIGAIMSAAEATVEGWTVQTRMGLESILEDHKTVNLSLDLQAPLLIIPLDPHVWASPCAVIDAGHMSIVSDLVPKETLTKYKNMSSSEYEKLDTRDIKRLMFDRFKLRLTDTQFLIGPDIRSTISNLNVSERESSFVILDKLEVELDVDVSILPKALNLPKIKIYGKLPLLKLSLNDYQYKVMMQLIDQCLPDLDYPESDLDSVDPKTSSDSKILNSLESKEVAILRQTLSRLQKMSEAELKQRLLQLTFDVEVIQLSIFKCNNAETMKSDLLVDLFGDRMHLTFAKKAQDMDLHLNLQSFKVVDHIDSGASSEFKNMIASSNENTQASHLFELKLNRAQRIVTYNNTLIEVFDQDVSLDMTELTFVLTPKSILTILNYTLTTFTNPEAPELPGDALKHNSPDLADAPQKINLRMNMDNIIVILNDDSVKLATFRLSAAQIEQLLLPEKMKINAKLGAMQLTNDADDGLSIDSPLRELISMSGSELAELTYETFDPSTEKLDYSSLLKYKTGSMNVNFVDHAVNKIVNYLAKFQKMKVFFDRAREAAYNQAGNIETVNNIKLDILVRAPVITFPKLIDPRRNLFDHVSFFLGEFFLQNSFHNEGERLVNKIKAGIRSGNLGSTFHMEHELTQNLHIIENLDLHFDIDHYQGTKQIPVKIDAKGVFEPLAAHLTELQLQYIYLLSQRLPNAFIIDYCEDDFAEIQDVARNANTFVSPEAKTETKPDPILFTEEEDRTSETEFSVNFTAPQLSLTIYNDTKNSSDISQSGITKISLNDIGLSLGIDKDSRMRAETHIASFTVDDIRKVKQNKHDKIIPKVSHDSYQFMASYTKEQHESLTVDNVNVTVDSPRIILALDYLFALKSFIDASVNINPPAKVFDKSPAHASPPALEQEQQPSSTKFQYSINVVDSSLVLLSDPSEENTEAIVFNVGQLLFADQNIMTASANNIGMFLCRMQSFDKNRIRLLDDFSSSILFDQRSSTSEKLITDVHASVEPLVMRLALRDIRLAMSIFNKAMTLAREHGLSPQVEPEADESGTKYGSFSKEFKKTLSRYAPSIVSSMSNISKSDDISEEELETIVKHEKLEANFEGLRLVLIGDIHELPIIDLSIKPFTLNAKDWTNDVEAVASIETYANVFNYSRSSWEPLLETVPLSFHLSKGIETDAALCFDIISRQLAEVSLSSRTIALLSQIPNSLYYTKDTEARGATKPYKICNDTGMDLKIWIASEKPQSKDQITILKSGETIPWEFEDWRKVRENLDTDDSMNTLGASIEGGHYESTLKIDVTSEGEDVYTLQPKVNGVHTRLACELKLCEDNVKLLIIRSTLTLENATSDLLEFKLSNEDGIFTINPGESRSIPAEKAYSSRFLLKPSGNYGWSRESISWRDLMSRPRSVVCENKEDPALFYYEVDAKFDKEEPLASIYPHMKVIISSPLILENLLPYSMKYKLFWRSESANATKGKEETETRLLHKGERVLIHSVTLRDYLLLAVQPMDDGLQMSEQSLINTRPNSELKAESKLFLKYENGQKLNLNLHYRTVEGSRAKIISVYSPYVILNGSNRDIQVEGDRNNIAISKVLLKDDSSKYTNPRMFSFERDRSNKNRARIKFKDSDWSVRTSFDAIGQSVDLTMDIPNKNQESNIGVVVSEGEGKYALSKIIKIMPRYILRNNLDVDLEVSEYGSSNVLTAFSKVSFPLYKMRNIVNKHLSIKFLGSQSEWSSPFMIKDIGSSYVKVLKNRSGHQLLKLDIVLEDSTIFISIDNADGEWPYSIRNFSDHEFIFYQRDPHTFDTEEDYDLYDDLGDMKYEALYYRVPPRSAMPYAWDYPAARQKKLVLVCRQRQREIQLAEIGNLRPMRIPSRNGNEAPAIVDLNVVADGPTQALIITNYRPELSLYKLKTGNTTSSSLSSDKGDRFEVRDEDKNVFTKVVVSFEGVGISLINTRLQELCYVTLNGLELRYNESDLYQTASVKLKWLQIDNQLFGGIFPNILYPTAIQKTAKELNNHPVLSGSVSKVKDDTHGVLYLKHATLLLQELTVQLDEDFLMALIDFTKVPGASWVNNVEDNMCTECTMLSYPSELQRNNDIYFEVFHLQPTMLHLSFVRTERLNVEGEKVDPQNTLMFFTNVLTMAFANINDAPIKLNSLFLDNAKVPLPMLMSAIQVHYGQQFFYQIHKILGSADFLGNPVGLFNNISSGVWDIFYEPYQGYMMNDRPQELGISIAKGGLSFVKKSVFGLSDSFARFTGSVAKGLSVATQDAQFQERRRLEQRKARNNKSINGFGSGATSFVNGVSSGLRGIAFDPYQGASKEGVPGFLKGLGKGLVGLPTKTAIGMLDLASNVSEGIRNTTTVMDGSLTTQVRLPRYIGYDKIIKPYNLRESQGQYWLKSANGGECITDQYLAHVVLPGKQLAVLVSLQHIIEVRLASLEIMWKVRYTDVRSMTLERAGLVIVLKGASSELFVPISDPEEKRFLYKNISVAVNEYNKYCQAEL
ncbi:membrane morphogenesis protein VPS13 [Lachancea thermotolerans CBS 6340]|uniref:Vacuolar protein sorting-associated protein n=1 Tax=Lachancea thermotolerans (strain ATCC 56472 / CBS 6340 / NRRL Y-8284) TaxID=559295 RepID=C5DHN4_LACTC|nr:KLTH0E05764p [Lachancea thermotolerans CBS 6340]CAR23295.1 KLTH0E05764p [Lachancea thermotolerans CBS 6340]